MEKSDSSRPGNYVVGKGRPPAPTRWKPGQSGNPKGRPKGRKNMLAHIDSALSRKINISEGGKLRRVTSREAIAIQTATRALKGDYRSVSRVLGMYGKNSVVTEREIVEFRKELTTKEAFEVYMKAIKGANIIFK